MYRFSGADLAFLLSGTGADALDAAGRLALGDSTLLADLPKLRPLAGQHAAAVVETVRLRRRAGAKLPVEDAAPDDAPGFGSWLYTDEALQQASGWPVALHRARRLLRRGRGVHDLTCSIGTDVAALHQLAGPDTVVVGSDLDPIRLRMARHNTPRPVLRADATDVVSSGLTRYADPARRAAGSTRRITGVDTIPSVAALDAAHAADPAVLRLPPGIDYESLDRPGEVEIVSLDGGAREAVLWPPAFATDGVRRRASVLSSEGTPWQVTDVDDDGASDTLPGELGRFLVDPDPAVVRAHLVRHWAFRHGLRLLDRHLAYLTGDAVPPGTRGFEILGTGPVDERSIARWIRAAGTGTLEIKQRGTGIDPQAYRRRLRSALGRDTTVSATLVLARVADGQRAYFCRAVRGPVPDSAP